MKNILKKLGQSIGAAFSAVAGKCCPQKLHDERLLHALETGVTAAEIEKILTRGANANTGRGQPLALAVRSDNTAYLHVLLRHGADPRIAGEMPLRLAVRNGKTAMAFDLVRFGADPQAAMIYAATRGHRDEVAMLDRWHRQYQTAIENLQRQCRATGAGVCNCPKPPSAN